MSYDERINLQKLWALIDEIHSSIWEKEKAGFQLTNTEQHIKQKALDGLRVPYPGEPPKLTGSEVRRILENVKQREKNNKND